MTMDIFCAPSRWEAAPYAVLEAMACGLPVVASAVPGHVDYIVHDVTGKLEEPELPGPIAGGLRALLANKDIRTAFGDAGRKRVERAFTIDAMLENLAALYQSVYAKQRTRQTAKNGDCPIPSA